MNLPFAMTLAGALAFATFAQDAPPKTQNAAPTGKPRQEIEVVAPERPKESEVNTNAYPKMPKQPTVSYGGVASDVRKSTNRWRIFSLRRPANLKEDEANVIRNLRTEGAPAVKLFSVDF
jgi:hypothetical protein